MIVKTGEALSWLVVADGAVIGDCGLHGGPYGPVDDAGRVEIGYGLAAPSRGQGYGSEVVAAITGWLLAQPEVRRVAPARSLTTCPAAASWRRRASATPAPRTARPSTSATHPATDPGPPATHGTGDRGAAAPVT